MAIEFLLVLIASFGAGLIDSIVGGGGLILTPALLASFPATPPPTLFGTNKSASVWGTLMSTMHYARRVQFCWPVLIPGVMAAAFGAFLGAWAVTQMNPDVVRQCLPAILLFVLIYTIRNKRLGATQARCHEGKKEAAIAALIGLMVGFYDGFFGPGTGTFFIFLFVRFLGFDFLHASAHAKALNVATNGAALILFSSTGHVWWGLGLALAVSNVLGSLLGTRLALRHGTVFVRHIFLGVVSLLIIKTAIDAWAR